MTAQADDELWSAIADPSRRRVLDLLVSNGAVSASWLAGHVPFSRQAVSKHLAVLDEAGLVSRRKQGREVLYQVEVWAGITLILIHHIGAKSRIERVSPLAYSRQGDGRFAIWAANGGSPGHPDWYYNLKADPRIKVEVDTQTFTVLAQELDDTARADLWPKLLAQYPQLGDAQAKTTRQIPVYMLTRQD